MTRWKGIGSQRLLWVCVALLAIGCVAAAAVAGTLYYRSADHIDLTIDLIPEEGYMVERSITLDQADTITVAVGTAVASADYQALPPRMSKSLVVEDQYGVIWNTDTKVEIFKTSYTNDEQQITVAGANGDKVIAPGTANDYTFSLYNNTENFVDYKMTMNAFVTGSDGETRFPVEARVKGINGWLLGDDNNWAPVLDLSTVEDNVVSKSHVAAVYTLEWRWPFESGQDELDTWLGNQEQDVTLTIGIETVAVYHPDGYDDDEEGDLEVDQPGGESGGTGGEIIPPSDPENKPPVVPPITDPVPEELRQKEHLAYIYGYPDGTVRPEANITRAEVAAIFYRLISDEVRTEYETTECQYPDVAFDAWYRREVATMTKMGVLKGYPDGTFRPDNNITRAELATIVSRFSEQGWKRGEKTQFIDIQGHWANVEIRSIEDKNWIIGYPDGTFRPDNHITRAETVTMVNRVLHRTPEQFDDLLEDMHTWPDNADTGMWYYIPIQEASIGHDHKYLWGTREKWVEIWEETPVKP